jgi:hypothetical protein
VAFPNDPAAAADVADKVARDIFAIATDEELREAQKTVAQREGEILQLLAGDRLQHRVNLPWQLEGRRRKMVRLRVLPQPEQSGAS